MVDNDKECDCSVWERKYAEAMPPKLVEKGVKNGYLRVKCVEDLLPEDSPYRTKVPIEGNPEPVEVVEANPNGNADEVVE